jgi:hypothetical protein
MAGQGEADLRGRADLANSAAPECHGGAQVPPDLPTRLRSTNHSAQHAGAIYEGNQA